MLPNHSTGYLTRDLSLAPSGNIRQPRAANFFCTVDVPAIKHQSRKITVTVHISKGTV